LGVEESQITPTASFTNDLGADSLDTVELIMEFERAFNITIEDTDAEKIQTVGDAISYLESRAFLIGRFLLILSNINIFEAHEQPLIRYSFQDKWLLFSIEQIDYFFVRSHATI